MSYAWQLQENIRQLSVEVSQQQEQMRLMQQLMAEQHEVQMELQKQHLEQATLRSTMQPTKDLEQQLGRVQNVVASRVERTLSTALQKENILDLCSLPSLSGGDSLLKDPVGLLWHTVGVSRTGPWCDVHILINPEILTGFSGRFWMAVFDPYEYQTGLCCKLCLSG